MIEEHVHEMAYIQARKIKCMDCGLEDYADHDCFDYPEPYVSDGPLGHGFMCGRCGAFLQAG